MSDGSNRRVIKPGPTKSAFDSADPPRNFTLSVNDRVRALTIGAPAFAVRKKAIEDLEAAHVDALVALHETHVGRGADHAAATRVIEARAASLDAELKKLNTLIETHNRYYPIEANLPLSLRTGGYLIYGKPWRPEPLWTAARLVEQALTIIAANDD